LCVFVGCVCDVWQEVCGVGGRRWSGVGGGGGGGGGACSGDLNMTKR